MTRTRQTLPGGAHRPGPQRRPSPAAPFRPSRTGRALLAGGLAVATATGGIMIAETANAVTPTFPDNVVVFPDRDFVTIEGYQDHIGQEATATVTRAGQVVGQAVGKVSAGDVALRSTTPVGTAGARALPPTCR